MTDVVETQPTVAPDEAVPAVETQAVPTEDKAPWAERVLGDILRLMEMPAKLELKDAADGGISVALHFEGELPKGVVAGRRSQLIDALQFLVNKVVNRPQTPRRWISLGVGAHPEPRPPPGVRPPRPTAPTASAPVPGVPGSPGGSVPIPPAARLPSALRGPRPQGQPSALRAPEPRPPPAPALDEAAIEVSEDTALAAAGRALAEKAARLGRFYGITPMKQDDRARLVRSAKGVAGVTAKVEGEGRNRRVVFTPDKPMPMPRKALPVDDVEDDEANDER